MHDFLKTVNGFARRLSWPKAAVLGVTFDLVRSRAALVAENTMLRQQLIVAARQVKRPKFKPHERALMIAMAAVTATWRSTLLLVKPETVLRWHREGFRILWKRKSHARSIEPKIGQTNVDLIRRMGRENVTWGAERIRGELLKLDIRISKRTIQKYLRAVRLPRPGGQTWKTFVRNHAGRIWACDFVQTFDVMYRPIFAFFIVHVGSRRVIYMNVTRHPTAEWVAQQLREATPFGKGPRFLIRDNDDKFGVDQFDNVAEAASIEVLKTPYKAPKANAFCERFLGSVRRECLDHVIILGERHMHSVLTEFVAYFNECRPHQGIAQQIPARARDRAAGRSGSRLMAAPILGGLHHDYRWAA